MTAARAIVAKELRAAFTSPIVYVVIGVFLLLFGVLSYIAVSVASLRAMDMIRVQGLAAQVNLNDLVFRPTFNSTAIILLLTMPILTMRLFAEERKLRTFELLMTAPVRLNDIVIGKFVAVVLIYLTMLSLTLAVPVMLATYTSFNWAPVATGYLGLILLGSLFLAIGLLASSVTENQIVAAFLAFGLLLFIWLLGALGTLLGDTPGGGILSYISFIEHFDRLMRGLVDTRDLVYYLSGIVLMLFLTHRVIESQRWK